VSPEATGCATTITVVQDDFEGSSTEVAVMVTACAVPGAVHTPVLESMVPLVADQVRPFVTPPVEVAEKVVLVPTVRVGFAGEIAPTTTVCGVTVTLLLATSPAAFVTVRVKVRAPLQFAVSGEDVPPDGGHTT
jgi:hypothetical protein